MTVLQPQPSRQLLRLQLTAHLAAAAALGLAWIPGGLRWAGLGLLAVSAWRTWRRHEEPLPRLSCRNDGSLWHQVADDWRALEVLPDSHISPGLTLLGYREEGSRKRRTLVLLPDSLPADDYRRFRVWLRWRAQGEWRGPASDPGVGRS